MSVALHLWRETDESHEVRLRAPSFSALSELPRISQDRPRRVEKAHERKFVKS
jgi:hypothetical protein